MSNAINMRASIPKERQLEVLRKDNPDIQALLAVYPEEQTAKLLKNKDKLNKIVKAFDNVSISRSQASMVITCREDCPYKEICILRKEGLAPFGHLCAVEKKIVAQLEFDVIQSLGIETDNPIEMELLWDLIDMKLLDMRASAALKDGKLVQKVEAKIGQNIMSKDELSPLIDAKLDLKRLKHSIIDAFVATRRAKKKYGTNNDTNSIEQMILQAVNNKTEDN